MNETLTETTETSEVPHNFSGNQHRADKTTTGKALIVLIIIVALLLLVEVIPYGVSLFNKVTASPPSCESIVEDVEDLFSEFQFLYGDTSISSFESIDPPSIDLGHNERLCIAGVRDNFDSDTVYLCGNKEGWASAEAADNCIGLLRG